MGAAAFKEVLAKEKLSQNSEYSEMVNRVGMRIAAVSGRPDYQWEFRVLASPEQNAFCLPGGKVAVYEGIIPICQSEAGLAVVMSHEVAHALARHGGERISQGYAVEAVRTAVSYVTQTQAEAQREMILRGYGVASQYGVILPYSRKHETEADHIGLMLMAQAGYDPEEAPRFWNRFATAQSGPRPIEFASTHPSDAHRAHYLASLLPQAMSLYVAAPQRFGLGDPISGAYPANVAQQPLNPTASATPQPAAATAAPGSPPFIPATQAALR